MHAKTQLILKTTVRLHEVWYYSPLLGKHVNNHCVSPWTCQTITLGTFTLAYYTRQYTFVQVNSFLRNTNLYM